MIDIITKTIILLNIIFLINLIIGAYNSRDDFKIPDVNDLKEVFVRRSNENIFFIETTLSGGISNLNARQACAIECAADMHPDRNVYVLLASKKMYKNGFDNIGKSLSDIPNVKIVRINLKDYVKYTQIEKLFTSGVIFESEYVKHHLSDLLRILTLWKYGGIYLDLDVMVVKPLHDLEYDWIGKDTMFTVNNAVISLSDSNTGRMIAHWILKEQANTFLTSDFRHNGPDALRRVLLEMCGADSTMELARYECHGFTVLPAALIYPVSQWKNYFAARQLDSILNMGDAYTHHYQDHASHDYKPLPSEEVAFTYFARTYCPNVFMLAENDFYQQRY